MKITNNKKCVACARKGGLMEKANEGTALKNFKKPRRKLNLSVFAIVAMIFLLLYSLSLVLPFLWSIMSSFKERIEFRINPFSWPKDFLYTNYIGAFKILKVVIETSSSSREVFLLELFFNTIVYCIGSTFFAVISPCITAYAVAKYKFKLRNVIFTIVIVTMVLPIVGSMPSEIQIIHGLGFYDNIVGIWITKGSFLGLNFLMFYATFKSFAWDYAEAAFMDGASHLRVLLTIMLPLAKTTILALGLLSFIGFWNEYQTQLLYLPSMPSVAYGLFSFQFTPDGDSSVTIQLAGCAMVSLPILVLYMCFKNMLIGNLAVGGIKG